MMYVLIALGIVIRLLPHAPNFSPIGALALVSGIYFSRRFSLFVPVVALFLSDLFIGFYDWRIMTAVYGSFMLTSAIGIWVRANRTAPNLIAGILCGSLIFFLITNAAVWAFSEMYPLNAKGLIQSYTMAIPFFRNSLLGDAFYSFLFIAIAEIADGNLIHARSFFHLTSTKSDIS